MRFWLPKRVLFHYTSAEVVLACFAHVETPAVDGVLVLDAGTQSFPFRNPAPHIWLHDSSPMAAIAIGEVLLGGGTHERGGWEITEVGE